MALADTARLISSLELQDKFSATASKYERTLGSMERKTSTLEKVGFQVGRGARSAIDNVQRIGVIAAGAIATQVALGVRSLAQLAEIENQTAAALESTSSAANVTAEEVRALAESLEDLSTVDDKVIQQGANLLLTFTKIRNEVGEGNDIFNRATDAALNLSIAGFGDMATTAKQVGKALNDPIKGVSALRKAGVQLTDQQTKQIEKFVESGDILKAQKVILAELEVQVGQSAEAFGKGPAADMRRFGDAVEAGQQALATGFLPLITKVSRMVQETLGDPQVQANIRTFGTNLAGGVEDLIDIALKLPWEAIGNAAKVMGQGAKTLLDAFTSLPPWVQTAVLTGWGLNKFFGGAPLKIGFELVKSAFGQLRGATPATPMFTKEVGIPGTGGGAPVVTGGGGLGRALLGGAAKIFGIAVAAEVGNLIGHALFFDPAVERPVKFEQSQFQQFLDNPKARADASIIAHNLEVVDSGLDDLIGETREGRIIGQLLFGDQLAVLEEQERILKELLAGLPQAGSGNLVPQNPGGTPGTPAGQTPIPEGSGADNAAKLGIDEMHKGIVDALARGDIKEAVRLKELSDAMREMRGKLDRRVNDVVLGLGRTNRALSVANRNLDDGNRKQQEISQGIREARDRIGSGFQATNSNLGTANSRLSTIASKDFSPNVNVTVNASTSVSISDIQRAASTLNVATSLSSQTRSGFSSGTP